MRQPCEANSLAVYEEEVLGRTTARFPLVCNGPHTKQCVQIFFYCEVFTKPLPSNDKDLCEGFMKNAVENRDINVA
jgi:hypothetical protein